MSINIKITGVDKFGKTAITMLKARQKMRDEIARIANLFGVNAISTIKEKYLSGPRPDKLGVGKGDLRARTMFHMEQSGNVTSIRFGNPLVYARIHELGGTTKPNVTKKMRAWSWHRFYETGDEIFKWLALTKKSKLIIKIPKRPYLSPGVREAFPAFKHQMAAFLSQTAREGLSGAR